MGTEMDNREQRNLMKQIDFYTQLISNHKEREFGNRSVRHSFHPVMPLVPPRSSLPSSTRYVNSRILRNSNAPQPSSRLTTFRNPTSFNIANSRPVRSTRTVVSNSNVWLKPQAMERTLQRQFARGSTSRTVNMAPKHPVFATDGRSPKQLPGSRLVSISGINMTVEVPLVSSDTSKLIANNTVPIKMAAASKPIASREVILSHCIQKPCPPVVKEPDVTPKKSVYRWSSKEESPTLTNKTSMPSTSRTRKLSTRRLISYSPYKCVNDSTPKPLMMHKTVKTKYKLIRKTDGRKNYQTSSKRVKTKYKIVNSKLPKEPSYQFVRKVGKYSIKYVDVKQSSKQTPKRKLSPRIPDDYMKHHLIKRVTKEVKSVASPSSKLILLGGILYRSTPMQLSKTEKKITNTIKVTRLNERKTNLITVRGVKFFMDPNGKTLKRVDSQKSPTSKSEMPHSSNLKFSRIDLGGKTYIQKEPGLLVQSHNPQSRSLVKRAVNRSINHFVTAKKRSTQFCMFYNLFGKCRKHAEGGKCPYIHDVDKVAVCTRFLKGKCTLKDCTFSHKVCETKMPVCSFFLRGKCTNDNCIYAHVNVNPKAEVCRDFLKGYCPHGRDCKKLHTFSCIQFEMTGKCPDGNKCPLKHIKIKERKRKLAGGGNACCILLKRRCTKFSDQSKASGSDTADLPSFIELADEDSNQVEQSPATPDVQGLRIKPSFLTDKHGTH